MDKYSLKALLINFLNTKEKDKKLFQSDELKVKKISRQINFINGFIEQIERDENFISYENSIEFYKEYLEFRLEIKLRILYNEEYLRKQIETLSPNVIQFFNYDKILQEIETSGVEQAKQNRMNKEMNEIEENIKILNKIVNNNCISIKEKNKKIEETLDLEIQNEELKKMAKIILNYMDSIKEEIIKEIKKD